MPRATGIMGTIYGILTAHVCLPTATVNRCRVLAAFKRAQPLSPGGPNASAQQRILSTYVCRGVHRWVRRGLVWVPAVEMGIVGVVMRVVSLRVVVPALPRPLIVVVVAVVLVCVWRRLQVLVWVRMHVMVAALLLPC